MIFQDLDLVELQWPATYKIENPKIQSNQSTLNTRVLHRSTVSEFSAQYQPKGQDIAFISQRSGSKQIWLARDGNKKAEQLSDFSGNGLESFRWSKTGDAILVVANRKLYLLSLTGEKQQLMTVFDVVDIYQVTEQNHLLLSIVEKENIKIALFNMTTTDFQVLYQGDSYLAQLTNENILYVIDEKNKFKKVTQDNEEHISELADLDIMSIFYRHNVGLLLEDSDSNFWRYNLVKKTKEIILPKLDDVYQITDVDLNNRRLLFNRITTSSREVVLLQ
jgi:dipeptidyl aminopeptidase/acylaminoacyl peptidase